MTIKGGFSSQTFSNFLNQDTNIKRVRAKIKKTSKEKPIWVKINKYKIKKRINLTIQNFSSQAIFHSHFHLNIQVDYKDT